MTAEIHKGDIGTKFLITITDNGVAIDVSAATTKEIHLKSPGGVLSTKTALFNTDGTDGKIYWTTTASSDLDEVGTWQIQAHLIIGTGNWHTSSSDFQVNENLD